MGDGPEVKEAFHAFAHLPLTDYRVCWTLDTWEGGVSLVSKVFADAFDKVDLMTSAFGSGWNARKLVGVSGHSPITSSTF